MVISIVSKGQAKVKVEQSFRNSVAALAVGAPQTVCIQLLLS